MTPSLPSLEAMVGDTGLEPARLSTLEPKSSASTNSANPPYMSPLIFDYRRNGTLKPPNSVAFNAPLRQTGNEVIEHYIRLRVLRIFHSYGEGRRTRTFDLQVNSLLL